MRANPSQEWIAKATRFRYTFPVLAELERDRGCKFVTLVRRLGANDRSIRQALDYLIDLGWVERNPGYGHPSRPEYLLCRGAPHTLDIWDELSKWGQEHIAMERWPLQALSCIITGRDRFSTIKSVLVGITPRALSMALAHLEQAGLCQHTLVTRHPILARYEATPWGTSLFALDVNQQHHQ